MKTLAVIAIALIFVGCCTCPIHGEQDSLSKLWDAIDNKEAQAAIQTIYANGAHYIKISRVGSLFYDSDSVGESWRTLDKALNTQAAYEAIADLHELRGAKYIYITHEGFIGWIALNGTKQEQGRIKR
jgi:hypothetical protein